VEPPETIDAGELTLKRWAPAWAEEAAKAVRASLPELRPFLPWANEEYDVDVARRFVNLSAEQWRDGIAFNYAVFTATGELVGSCGLMARVGPGALEIGYWIHSGHAGRGYATAVATALARAALAMPAIQRVVIKHDAANPASGRVAAKAGFVEVDRVESEPTAPGQSGLNVVWERR
jgi:RimJ/RimL family protein N-acetyltransferase